MRFVYFNFRRALILCEAFFTFTVGLSTLSVHYFISDFDIRVTPTVNIKDFETKIEEMCKQAGDGVKHEFLQVPN